MRYRVLRNPAVMSRKLSALDSIVDDIANTFHDVTPPPDYPLLTLDDQRLYELHHLRDKDPVQLRKFRALVKRLAKSNRAYDALYSLRYALFSFFNSEVEILHTYQGLLVKYPNSPLSIAKLHTLLIDTHNVQPGVDGTIPTLEAHLRAKQHYSKHLVYVGKAPDDHPAKGARNYESNHAYVASVQKHAAHVDTLMRYRDERGIVLTNGDDNFDPADFEEYLTHSALADGWV